MTEARVRAAVDAAIRRHLDARRSAPAPVGPGYAAALAASDPAHGRHLDAYRSASTPIGPEQAAAPPASDPAHGRFLRVALPGDPPAGRCVIEPSVPCTGCGYCQSQGH